MTDLQLDTLEARGLIRIAAYQPELEYFFRHALLQDAAYESLLKQERRSLHHVVGEALEEIYPDRVGELSAILGMHFEQAGDREKALHYLFEAARFAGERNAIVESYDLFTRAGALLPEHSETEGDDVRRLRLQIELGRARSGFAFMSETALLDILNPLVPEAERLGDLQLEAEVHLSIALFRQLRGERSVDNPELARSLGRVAEIAEELHDPWIAALPESLVGLTKVFSGDLRGGVELLEKTAPQLEQKQDFVGSSFAMMALAQGYARLGDFSKAEEVLVRAQELAEKGDIIARLDTLIGISMVRAIKGDIDGAVPVAKQCTDLAEESGAIACVVASNFVLGDVYMQQRRYGDAKIALDRSHEVATSLEQHGFRPSIVALTRLNSAYLGDLGSSTGTFEEALEEARTYNDPWAVATIRWKRAQTVAHADEGANREQMLEDYAAAAAAFDEMGSSPYRARVLRDWGLALRGIGRVSDGNEKLGEALRLMDELGIAREADEIRQTLDAA